MTYRSIAQSPRNIRHIQKDNEQRYITTHAWAMIKENVVWNIAIPIEVSAMTSPLKMEHGLFHNIRQRQHWRKENTCSTTAKNK